MSKSNMMWATIRGLRIIPRSVRGKPGGQQCAKPHRMCIPFPMVGNSRGRAIILFVKWYTRHSSSIWQLLEETLQVTRETQKKQTNKMGKNFVSRIKFKDSRQSMPN